MQTYAGNTADVKGLYAGRFQVNVHEKFEAKIARLLKESPVDQQEAMLYTGSKKSTVYAWYKTGKIPTSAMVVIGIVAATRGYYALHELMWPAGMTVTLTNERKIDGSLNDNLASFMPCLGEAVKEFEQGDYADAKLAMDAAIQEIEGMAKEIVAKIA
jgi:hypothetical protein